MRSPVVRVTDWFDEFECLGSEVGHQVVLEGRRNEVEGHINRDLLPVEYAVQLWWGRGKGGAGEGQGI